MQHHLSLILVLTLLSSCGGSVGGGVSDRDFREPIVPIIPEILEGPAGTASYDGQIGLGFLAPTSAQAMDLDGDLTLQVDFDNATEAVSGFAGGFHREATPFVGTLFLGTGALDQSDGGLDFVAQISGSLQNSSDTYLIFGQIGGEFIGSSQQVAVGQVLGTARQAGMDAPLTGQFQATRQ